MKKDPLVIYGSSREEGNTRHALSLVLNEHPHEFIDLRSLDISYFDYTHANEGDDFLSVAEKMLSHEKIILATPVYWYTMSAMMKTFIDRWSDLITIRKEMGRALKGKWVYVVSSYGSEYPCGFEDPFRLTCQYLDMHYGGAYLHYSGNDTIRVEENTRQVSAFKHLLFD
ncbi:MAG: FMN reductase [Waddliaceae bacterium]|nr:FMN reductase [Waddliaceae bacterium]